MSPHSILPAVLLSNHSPERHLDIRHSCKLVAISRELQLPNLSNATLVAICLGTASWLVALPAESAQPEANEKQVISASNDANQDEVERLSGVATKAWQEGDLVTAETLFQRALMLNKASGNSISTGKSVARDTFQWNGGAF